MDRGKGISDSRNSKQAATKDCGSKPKDTEAMMGQSKEISVSKNSRKADMENDGERILRMPRKFEVSEERSDINRKADDFIKNFRNQLKIQREESLKRFQEMISRGT